MAKGDSARGVVPGGNWTPEQMNKAWQSEGVYGAPDANGNMQRVGASGPMRIPFNFMQRIGMGGGMGRMGQQNPYQMGIGAGLNNQPMQGLFGNAGNQMPQANMLPTSNQSVQSFLNPNQFGGQKSPWDDLVNSIGGRGGVYF